MNAPPIKSYGASTGLLPIQVRIVKVENRSQVASWWREECAVIGWGSCIGRVYKIVIEANIMITPPSLFGIDRRMA